MTQKKKRNPQDLTLRNLRAMKCRISGVEADIRAMLGMLEVLRNESDEAWRRIVTLENMQSANKRRRR